MNTSSFYKIYPQIVPTVSAQLENPTLNSITEKALVKYALAGMDDNLFVSKYQLELPKKEEMEKFIEEKLKEAELGGLNE